MDEADFFRSSTQNLGEFREETKDPLLKAIKERLFMVFARVNSMKVSFARHYHVILIGIETCHLLSIVLNDGSYSAMGPYQEKTPWNHGQSQWLIDICWVIRVDRYLRTSLGQYVALMCIWATLISLLICVCVFLGVYEKTTGVTNIACKLAKVLLSLLTNTLYIPICDSFAFGMKCSLSGGTHCLGLATGYGTMLGFVGGLGVYLAVCGVGAVLYYDLCMVCGNAMAKPHPRVKLVRMGSYLAMIMMYYFIDISGNIILFLVLSLLLTLLLTYLYAHYLPHYSLFICKLRLSALTLYLSALLCMLIGEFFKSTDQSNSSVSMLFYFLTPCLVQILLLAMDRRGQILTNRKFQQITNIYQVEIKGRLMVIELEKARSLSVKSLYEEGEEQDEVFKQLETRTLTELETLYLEAFRKFPNSEYLYLWSGLLQLHIFKNYILAMVQCFKGLALANKLDSQYALSYFRKTSESLYKANMKDDAYEFVQFEKCSAVAQRHDETVTRAQFHFWSELESKHPRIQKLMKLATEMTNLVNKTKGYYEGLLKLNGKSASAMRMFGGFLQSLSGYADLGQRYLQKAEALDNPENNLINPSVANSTTQPLSFFDSENAIITVSGDFETIGEIQKVGVAASTLFGYLQAEFVGRNISLLIPEPFESVHDANMRQFHENGRYNTIDLPNLILYFVNKKGYLFEARTLIKVVPNSINPPFFLAAIKPKIAKHLQELAMLSTDLMVTGYSQGFADMFELGGPKSADHRITNLIPEFENLREKMMSAAGTEITHIRSGNTLILQCSLTTLTIGKYSAYILHLKMPGESEEYDVGAAKTDPQGSAISTLQAGAESSPQSKLSPIVSSNESESESDESDSDDSDEQGSEESSEGSKTEQVESAAAKRITFHDIPTPGMVADGQLPEAGNESKPLMKRNIRYSDAPDILYDGSSHSKGSAVAEDISESSKEQPPSEEISGNSEEMPEEVDKESSHGGQSASSRGSSMASSAQFTKSIKALMSFQFTAIHHHVLRFKITLFLTMIILIATSVTTFQVIQSSVQFNERLSHYVNLVGRLRLYSQSLSYYSRMLSLIDSNLLPPDNRTSYQSWMTADLDDMHAINLELYRNFGLLDSTDRETYFRETIPVWLLEGRDIVHAKSNLFDATSNLVVQSFLLLKEAQHYNFTNRRLFYIYRNGLGETLQTLNRSSGFYVDAALRDISNQRLVAIMLIVVSVILLVLCAVLAIIPALRALEKAKAEIWEVFFEVPGYVCRIMRSKCGDRLQILNEAANLEIEEINPDAGEHEDGDNKNNEGDEGIGAKHDKGRKVSGRGKKKEAKGVLSYDPKARKVVLGKLMCFLVINLVYFYLIYYTGFEAAGELLKQEPTTIDWASRRRHLSRAVNHWVTESLLENVTDVGFKYLIPQGQHLSSPSHHALSLLSELEYVENSLIFGNPDYSIAYSGLRSAQHDSLLFTDACGTEVNRSETDCGEVADKALAQGMHSALGMYVTLARTILIRNERDGTEKVKERLGFGELALLRSLDERYLYDPLAKSSELYESDFTAGQSHMHIYQNLLISLYIVSAVLFYLFIYHPMIQRLGQDAKNSWSLCALLPQEYQEEFRKLVTVIKERRDRFKWR